MSTSDTPTQLVEGVELRREYLVREADGSVRRVALRFFDCTPVDEGKDWGIKFTVEGLCARDEHPRTIYGVDALQALLNALRVARGVLQSDASYREGRMSLAGAPQSSDLGLGD